MINGNANGGNDAVSNIVQPPLSSSNDGTNEELTVNIDSNQMSTASSSRESSLPQQRQFLIRRNDGARPICIRINQRSTQPSQPQQSLSLMNTASSSGAINIPASGTSAPNSRLAENGSSTNGQDSPQQQQPPESPFDAADRLLSEAASRGRYDEAQAVDIAASSSALNVATSADADNSNSTNTTNTNMEAEIVEQQQQPGRLSTNSMRLQDSLTIGDGVPSTAAVDPPGSGLPGSVTANSIASTTSTTGASTIEETAQLLQQSENPIDQTFENTSTNITSLPPTRLVGGDLTPAEFHRYVVAPLRAQRLAERQQARANAASTSTPSSATNASATTHGGASMGTTPQSAAEAASSLRVAAEAWAAARRNGNRNNNGAATSSRHTNGSSTASSGRGAFPALQRASNITEAEGNRSAQNGTTNNVVNPNGPSVTIQINRNTGATNIVHHNGTATNPMMVPRGQRVAQVAPLVPQPIQYATPKPSSNDNNSDWTCPICMDFLHTPVGCGNCDYRFCKKCLHRVAHQQQKCPCCRGSLACSTIVEDEELGIKMKDAKVTCSFCNKDSVKLADWKQHENECKKVRLSCRYKTWGCNWVGPRDSLITHEREECALCPVKGLIEQVRQDRLQQQQIAAQLQMGLTASTQRVERLAYTVTGLQGQKSVADVLDIMHLVYTSICLPGRFRAFKDGVWRPMHSSRPARASIVNFLTLMPTVVQCTKIATSGLRLFVELLHRMQNDGQNEDLVDTAEDIVVAACIALLCVLSLVCFFVDGQRNSMASLIWQNFNIAGKPQPVLQYVVGIVMLAIHAFSILWNGPSALLVWFLVLTTSTVMPALMATHLEAINVSEELSRHYLFSQGRATLVVQFGLRFALLVAFCGIMPCIDAVMLCSVLLKVFGGFWRRCLVLEHTLLEPLVSNMKLDLATVMVVCRAAVLLAHETNALHDMDLLLETVSKGFNALFVLILSNVLIEKLLVLGYSLAQRVISEGVSGIEQSAGGTIIRREYSAWGMCVLGTWLAMLGAIWIAIA